MDIPVRRTLRWRGCDYSEPDSFFVTVCVQDRIALFGQIIEAEMKCKPAGEMVRRWWNEIRNRFTNVGLDESVVMPNHVHGIFFFTRQERDVTISRVMNWFKTMTTNEYIRGVTTAQWRSFEGVCGSGVFMIASFGTIGSWSSFAIPSATILPNGSTIATIRTAIAPGGHIGPPLRCLIGCRDRRQ